ncbi:PAS domain-containing protein [Sulfurospirillum multivorans]|uniref:PAS sensor domain-containing protein n=2 Tax=Sulfurospirillum multivorans TaxID=66821 RepID=A0AA86DXI7_SULMK|nr:PAS domain-containing protein [Sulfurospirillum multivorans]AHJ12098.1 PAS sensor domain-containing protein [Sulfurospirillum multivorans DSM 12446]QEH05599.1 PAS sensor domain-containing protein [Sulfurospirillum multivorans]
MQTVGDEILLDETSLLVSETDAKGNIVYADETFVKFSEYSLEELIGKPHNMIRHPDMPKATFKELWESLKQGNVWQGFVKNRTKSGKFYWVYATIFPFGKEHYLSVRKMASKDEVEKYTQLYAIMRASERQK